jgi:hypothetical protein
MARIVFVICLKNLITTPFFGAHTDHLGQDTVQQCLHQSAIVSAMAATPSDHPNL